MDTWIALSTVYETGERRRSLHVLKSRGMRHSHELHELRMTPSGLEVGGTLAEAPSAGGPP